MMRHDRRRAGCALLGCLALPAALAADPVSYDVPVTLTGRLISALAGHDLTPDERPHRFPALQLPAPLTVVCAASETDCETATDVTRLQLVLDPDLMRTFQRGKGRMATVTGTLFPAETGHHFTPVLLEAKTIAPELPR